MSEKLYSCFLADFMLDCECGKGQASADNLRRKYVGNSSSIQNDDGSWNFEPSQIIAASLPLDRTYEEYVAKCRKKYKGAALRNAKKAEKLGYTVGPFNRKKYARDVEKINKSMPERSGGPMKPGYLKTADEMGYDPTALLIPPECHHHWNIMYGAFWEDTLYGYINLKRIGNFLLYSQILGHGEHLKAGIMYQLHFFIVEASINEGFQPFYSNEYFKGLDHIVYAGFYSGRGPGLQQWKKSVLFEPVFLVEVV